MLHMLFRMLLVFPPVCLMLHTLFRMLPVSPLVCLLLRTLFRMLPVSLPVYLLLRTLFRMLHWFLFLLSFSIQKDSIMPFCYLLINFYCMLSLLQDYNIRSF
jgi:hypothetical protein